MPASPSPSASLGPRARDTQATIADILAVATQEFAAKGYDGARVDAIAAATRTSKRMIYYHYDGKEGLYLAVLEAAYRRIRAIEATLHLDDLPPLDALRELTGFTHDYHLAHPDFVRLVMTENIQHGVHLARSAQIRALNAPAIVGLSALCQRGIKSGQFRPDLDPVDLHATISALAFYNVSNRQTFALIFQHDINHPDAVAARRASIIDTVARSVLRQCA